MGTGCMNPILYLQHHVCVTLGRLIVYASIPSCYQDRIDHAALQTAMKRIAYFKFSLSGSQPSASQMFLREDIPRWTHPMPAAMADI